MQHIIACNLYLITFFMFAKSQLSSKRPLVFYLMMDLVQASIPIPPGTAWKTVQVALRPNPSQKLAITFIHTQRALVSYRRLAHHSLKMLMASCAALIKATLKSELLMQRFTKQNWAYARRSAGVFMVDLINKPVYVCETLTVRRLGKSMLVIFGFLSLKPRLAPESTVYTCKTSLYNLKVLVLVLNFE